MEHSLALAFFGSILWFRPSRDQNLLQLCWIFWISDCITPQSTATSGYTEFSEYLITSRATQQLFEDLSMIFIFSSGLHGTTEWKKKSKQLLLSPKQDQTDTPNLALCVAGEFCYSKLYYYNFHINIRIGHSDWLKNSADDTTFTALGGEYGIIILVWSPLPYQQVNMVGSCWMKFSFFWKTSLQVQGIWKVG